ncbi:pseudouridine synthase [Catenovulum maritimum]|uniref:Ribosomal small subunit pseudouridine synthase A n=1 Tax=Catenovulum maritimum TaxID=1513271 RepID=A0A0J8JLX9_9ALTE|nr:pseudouridine synthase [Catenovulum maritimum]KMT65566.1 16S rRNA pseudouridylate synthase [Catenovulum maritimum]
MRLDKYLCESTEFTRKTAKMAIAAGDVEIDGVVVTNPATKVTAESHVQFRGADLGVVGLRYIMLNKPIDTICSTVDSEDYQSVLSLLEIEKPERLHIAGRLDADTTGMVLITDDGKWSHRVTSPKKACGKTYLAELAEPMDEAAQAEAIELFEQGFMLKSEDKPTLPAQLKFIHPDYAEVTVMEGRYHQVKRMFAAIGNKVTYLHRAQIGELDLADLEPCEWRYLTQDEVDLF